MNIILRIYLVLFFSLYCFSLKSQNELKEKTELKNQISLGVNIIPIISDPVYYGFNPPYLYTLNYKRKFEKYNFRSGIEFNYISRKDDKGNKSIYNGLLGKIGVERVLPMGKKNNFLLGADIVGFTEYWIRYRTYGFGGGISPACKFI